MRHRNVHPMSERTSPEPNIGRIATGIFGADLILGGGCVAGSVQLLIGRPGAGKTIFANQLAFHHASEGHTAAYVTLLAESHARMLTHLASFSFFEPDLVSRRIFYMSGYSVLEQSGLDGLLELLTRTIRDQGASLLIIDGLTTAKEFAPTTTAFKRFLLRLSTSASLTSCTTLLVSSITRLEDAHPESGTVDGIVRLGKRTSGARVVREFMVEKMRATKYALGPHAFDIDHEGIHVYPRIESMPVKSLPPVTKRERLEFGIPGLDDMLGGGVLEASTTVIVGPTGTGKTLIGSSFLGAGLQKGEPAIYVGLRETPEQVIQQASSVGLHLEEPLARGLLEVLWFPAVETPVDAVAWALLDRIERSGIRRVFIDGIDTLHAMLVHPERLLRFYAGLVAQLAALGATTVMAESTGIETVARTLLNNVLVLNKSSTGQHVRRFIASHKVQAGPHDLSPRRIRVSSKGLSVARRWVERMHRDKP
jgi:circadian clock protein KaiC